MSVLKPRGHPGIINMIEKGRVGLLKKHKDEETKEPETIHYIILELAENGDLCDIIKKGRFSESDACDYAKEFL